MKYKKKREYLEILLAYIVVVISIAFFIFPLIQFAITSVRPTKYLLTSIIPRRLTLDNYRRIMAFQVFTKPLINSIIVSSLSTLIVVAVSILAAYSLTKFQYKKKEDIAFFILSLYMFPPIVAIIPIRRIAGTLGFLDNHIFLSATYAFLNLPFTVWLLRNFFISIPREIEEASLIDGCSLWGSLFRVTLPLALPGIAVAIMFSFIFSWIEFLFAVILTETETITIPVAIASQVTYFIEWGRLASMATLSIAPVLLLSIFLQKYIISGLTFGAVKG